MTETRLVHGQAGEFVVEGDEAVCNSRGYQFVEGFEQGDGPEAVAVFAQRADDPVSVVWGEVALEHAICHLYQEVMKPGR